MTSPSKTVPHDEAKYWAQSEVVRGEIEGAVKAFHTYNEIHAFAAEDVANYNRIQEHAGFWITHTYCLQSTLFVVIGRIFDRRKDSHSIHKFLAATVAHPEFFSRAALSARVASRISPMPEWVNKVNEPTKADLKRLEDALLPHTDKYNQIYKPIRHEVFAHKKPMDDQDLAALFGKTRIEELGETLRFLYESTVALRELFQNGTALVFQNGEFRATTDYDGWTKTIRSSTRAVLTAL